MSNLLFTFIFLVLKPRRHFRDFLSQNPGEIFTIVSLRRRHFSRLSLSEPMRNFQDCLFQNPGKFFKIVSLRTQEKFSRLSLSECQLPKSILITRRTYQDIYPNCYFQTFLALPKPPYPNISYIIQTAISKHFLHYPSRHIQTYVILSKPPYPNICYSIQTVICKHILQIETVSDYRCALHLFNCPKNPANPTRSMDPPHRGCNFPRPQNGVSRGVNLICCYNRRYLTLLYFPC